MKTIKPFISVFFLLGASCQFITVEPPVVEPLPAVVYIDDARLNGEYRYDHLAGITTLMFDGTDDLVMHYYNSIDGVSFYRRYKIQLQSNLITTYTEDYPIEEFGQFYQRPYRFEGNNLIITGLTTNGDAPLDFTFRRVL